jgi:hypothetical protein
MGVERSGEVAGQTMSPKTWNDCPPNMDLKHSVGSRAMCFVAPTCWNHSSTLTSSAPDFDVPSIARCCVQFTVILRLLTSRSTCGPIILKDAIKRKIWLAIVKMFFLNMWRVCSSLHYRQFYWLIQPQRWKCTSLAGTSQSLKIPSINLQDIHDLATCRQ